MALIDKNYVEKLANVVAKTLVDAFENITIKDVQMYQLGYKKGIDDFLKSAFEVFKSDPIGYAQLMVIAAQLKGGAS